MTFSLRFSVLRIVLLYSGFGILGFSPYYFTEHCIDIHERQHDVHRNLFLSKFGSRFDGRKRNGNVHISEGGQKSGNAQEESRKSQRESGSYASQSPKKGSKGVDDNGSFGTSPNKQKSSKIDDNVVDTSKVDEAYLRQFERGRREARRILSELPDNIKIPRKIVEFLGSEKWRTYVENAPADVSSSNASASSRLDSSRLEDGLQNQRKDSDKDSDQSPKNPFHAIANKCFLILGDSRGTEYLGDLLNVFGIDLIDFTIQQSLMPRHFIKVKNVYARRDSIGRYGEEEDSDIKELIDGTKSTVIFPENDYTEEFGRSENSCKMEPYYFRKRQGFGRASAEIESSDSRADWNGAFSNSDSSDPEGHSEGGEIIWTGPNNWKHRNLNYTETSMNKKRRRRTKLRTRNGATTLEYPVSDGVEHPVSDPANLKDLLGLVRVSQLLYYPPDPNAGGPFIRNLWDRVPISASKSEALAKFFQGKSSLFDLVAKSWQRGSKLDEDVLQSAKEIRISASDFVRGTADPDLKGVPMDTIAAFLVKNRKAIAASRSFNTVIMSRSTSHHIVAPRTSGIGMAAVLSNSTVQEELQAMVNRWCPMDLENSPAKDSGTGMDVNRRDSNDNSTHENDRHNNRELIILVPSNGHDHILLKNDWKHLKGERAVPGGAAPVSPGYRRNFHAAMKFLRDLPKGYYRNLPAENHARTDTGSYSDDKNEVSARIPSSENRAKKSDDASNNDKKIDVMKKKPAHSLVYIEEADLLSHPNCLIHQFNYRARSLGVQTVDYAGYGSQMERLSVFEDMKLAAASSAVCGISRVTVNRTNVERYVEEHFNQPLVSPKCSEEDSFAMNNIFVKNTLDTPEYTSAWMCESHRPAQKINKLKQLVLDKVNELYYDSDFKKDKKTTLPKAGKPHENSQVAPDVGRDEMEFDAGGERSDLDSGISKLESKFCSVMDDIVLFLGNATYVDNTGYNPKWLDPEWLDNNWDNATAGTEDGILKDQLQNIPNGAVVGPGMAIFQTGFADAANRMKSSRLLPGKELLPPGKELMNITQIFPHVNWYGGKDFILRLFLKNFRNVLNKLCTHEEDHSASPFGKIIRQLKRNLRKPGASGRGKARRDNSLFHSGDGSSRSDEPGEVLVWVEKNLMRYFQNFLENRLFQLLKDYPFYSHKRQMHHTGIHNRYTCFSHKSKTASDYEEYFELRESEEIMKVAEVTFNRRLGKKQSNIYLSQLKTLNALQKIFDPQDI